MFSGPVDVGIFPEKSKGWPIRDRAIPYSLTISIVVNSFKRAILRTGKDNATPAVSNLFKCGSNLSRYSYAAFASSAEISVSPSKKKSSAL